MLSVYAVRCRRCPPNNRRCSRTAPYPLDDHDILVVVAVRAEAYVGPRRAQKLHVSVVVGSQE